MGLSLGHLFDGIKTGAEKGLHYDRDFMGLIAWAVHTNNEEAIKACGEIAAKHAAEIGGVLSGGGVGLIFNGDPFAGSRKLTQDALAKFGRH